MGCFDGPPYNPSSFMSDPAHPVQAVPAPPLEARHAIERATLGLPSPLVTVQAVGETHYRENPFARAAVQAGLQQDAFIRVLLDEHSRLVQEVIRLRLSTPDPTVFLP
jgi:hypothetical protein